MNFMNWFPYGWVHNVFDDCIMCFGELYVMGIGFSWFLDIGFEMNM